MSVNRAIVGALALLALVAALDGLRSGGERAPAAPDEAAPERRLALRVDLASSRAEPPVPRVEIERRFAGVVSKVAVQGDLAAVAVSDVPGTSRPRAAIQIWEDGRHRLTFRVKPGSFSRGLWFTDGGTIATFAWNRRGYVYDLNGRAVLEPAYFAYETR